MPAGQPRWRLKRWRTAYEAVLTWVGPPREQQDELLLDAPEPARPARDDEYGRRAAGCVRRWIRHNRCKYMWTFTFRTAIYDYAAVAQAVDQLRQRLNDYFLYKLGQAAEPLLILVPEPHPGGHGWHLHGATDVYIAHKLMAGLWGRGYVFVTRSMRGKRDWVPRSLSRYLAKYVAKALVGDELHGCSPRPAGAHRYFVPHGREPKAEVTWHQTFQAAEDFLYATWGPEAHQYVFGHEPGPVRPGIWYGWDGADLDGWEQRVQAGSRAERG